MTTDTFWSNVQRWFFERMGQTRNRRQRQAAVLAEIGKVAAETGAEFLNQRKFAKKLIAPVECTLKYINDGLQLVPGPVTIDLDHWNADPYLNIPFASAEEMQRVLHTSKELQAVLQTIDSSAVFALLTMEKKQKTISGVEKNGEIIRRDVLQSAVYFEDHRILAPCLMLAEAREKVRHQALTALVIRALKEIDDLHEWKKELETQHKMLEFFLQSPTAEEPLSPPALEAKKMEDAKQLKVEIDRKIDQIRFDLNNPKNLLNHVTEVLTNPRRHLRLDSVRLRLNSLNIQVKEASDEPVNDITLAEFELGGQRKRAALWIQVPAATMNAGASR